MSGARMPYSGNDLSVSGLISGQYGNSTTPDCESISKNCAVANPATVLPSAKIGNASFVMAYGDPTAGRNFFQVVGGATSDSDDRTTRLQRH